MFPTSTHIVLAILTALAAGLAIWGHAPSRRAVHLVCKPLAMLFILAAVLVLDTAAPGRYRLWVVVALVLSVAGDVLLMLADRLFAAGLGAFLLALVAYQVALATPVVGSLELFACLLYPLAPALFVLGSLWPRLGRLKPAVLFYVAAMTGMVTLAIARTQGSAVSTLSAACGVAGASLFMLSDSLVACRRFTAPKAPYAVELGSYFAAQWLLAATTWMT
ncbi:MAG: lysoplasmalogenase [Deltaproteobacteria bacterium]|nr:lysoplasmalogenase [Deltaproteobacteria bacterium]